MLSEIGKIVAAYEAGRLTRAEINAVATAVVMRKNKGWTTEQVAKHLKLSATRLTDLISRWEGSLS